MSDVYDLVIRGGRIVTPDGVITGDLGVKGEQIASIGTPIAAAKQEIHAQEMWIMPGGGDQHTHIEQMSDMGQMNADTFETATRSDWMGGTTSVICFAAEAKGEPLADTVNAYTQRSRRRAMIDQAFHIMVTDTSVPDFATDLERLIGSGHRSLKVFTTYNIQLSDRQILDTMALARRYGALVCVHAENDAIIARAKVSLIEAGQLCPVDHALSHPPMAEIEAVARICRFAEYLDQPVMLLNISTAEAAQIVRQARAKGRPIWAETCPH